MIRYGTRLGKHSWVSMPILIVPFIWLWVACIVILGIALELAWFLLRGLLWDLPRLAYREFKRWQK